MIIEGYIRIEVLQEDIDNSIACCVYHCPIARAFQRILPELKVWAGPSLIILTKEGSKRRVEIPTPPEVKRFMEAFDRGRPVSPFTFKIAPQGVS